MQFQARDLIMLYIFDVLESNYFKFGWTERPNAHDRIQNGFWTNIHPEALCQKGDPENNPEKFAPSNLNLTFLFQGDMKLESVIKSLFPPECGEFWKKEDLELGNWNLELGSWNLGLGTWELELGTWNLGRGTWNLGIGWGRCPQVSRSVQKCPEVRNVLNVQNP